ncbi:MAG: hypothetical protein QF902_11750, partial [Rhodospirillales bacterium]|nr:hypothetical protein [Rhodospirillales bacterium]
MSETLTARAANVLPSALMRPRTLEQRDNRLGIALVVPSAIFFIVLIAYPLVQAIFLSFYKVYTPTLSGPYVAFGQYIALFSDPEFWTSLRNNIVWTVGTLFLQITFGVAIAMMLHQNFPVRALARALCL